MKLTVMLRAGGNLVRKYLQILGALFLVLVLSGSCLAESYQGRVLRVEAAGPQPYEEEVWESQIVTVRLLNGPHKNQTIEILHTLTGHPYFDLVVKAGDKVILEADFSGTTPDYYLSDYARGTPLAIITALFILSVIVIGGRQGVKAVFSLIGMGIVIVTMILPLVLRGYNPIFVTVGLSSLMTLFFILFVSGYSKKTAAAVCGTVGGLLTAGLLAFVIGKAGYLTGLSSSEAQILQYMDTSIDFQGLLFSGMIVGALGAILDVGISIASSMEQIKEADPTTDFKTLFTRGIAVGKDLIATMSNTLILAYVGSSLPLLLLFQASDSSWSDVLNLDMVASEIIRAMAGSIGLTLAIPITAFVSALLF
ncbi:MAG TPA: YibE/F family protein, partial [Limnochordia bacterium]|nr:YibE/F family protein [Limnochordia bacterium]